MKKEQLILLLKQYKENNAKLKLRLREKESLLRKLEHLKEVDVSSSPIELNGDIHSKNKIGDKTGNNAIDNLETEAEIREKIKELEEEITELTMMTEEIDIRLEALKDKEKVVLKAYYIDGCTYEDIGNRVYYERFNQTRSVRNIQDIVEAATNKMLKL